MINNLDILKTVNEWVKVVDTKAGAILAFAGGSIAFLAAHVQDLRSVIMSRGGDGWGILLYVVFLLYCLFLVATVAFCFVSVWPRTSKGLGKSLIFFRTIDHNYEGHPEGYHAALSRLDEEAFALQVSEQIVAVSHVATRKHLWINRALLSLFGTGVFWIICLAIWFILGTPPSK